MAVKQSIGIPGINLPRPAGASREMLDFCDAMEQAVNRQLRHITTHLDQAIGARGVPTYLSDVNANGKRITDLGDWKHSRDAVRAGLALKRKSEAHDWDVDGAGLANVRAGKVLSDGVNLGQINRAIDQAVQNVTNELTTETGSFTVTGVGFSGSVSGSASYASTPDHHMIILFLPTLSGTSNDTAFNITGLPGALEPSHTSYQIVSIADNSTDQLGTLVLSGSSSVITLLGTAGGGDWFNVGTKTLYATMVAYVK